MFIFYKEVPLDIGLDILNKPRSEHRVDGDKISQPSGAALWKDLADKKMQIKCWHCGVEADRFIVKHHPKDMEKPPVLELFAHTGKSLVMMTRDHIIPKSLGGLDSVENLRPGCEPCNRRRQNKMNKKDQTFMDNNPHLWVKKELSQRN